MISSWTVYGEGVGAAEEGEEGEDGNPGKDENGDVDVVGASCCVWLRL